MIHYTLLPVKIRQSLRKEYRLRLAILAFLIISCSVVIGIISLLPSYFYSASQKKDVLARQEIILRTRKESGAEKIESDLIKTQVIAEKINTTDSQFSVEDVIEKIVSHRTKDIFIFSFDITRAIATTSLAKISVQGKAVTREALLKFKTELESDPAFSALELPLSDLAKNKNIMFSLRMTLKK